MKTFTTSLRLLLALTLLTGFVYPLIVLVLGHALFPAESSGSLVLREGRVVGSELLSQKTTDPRLFWPRPSAVDYATLPSGASSLPWTSAQLRERVLASGLSDERATMSASGLDPHLGLESIRAQIERVAVARGWRERSRTSANAWIAANTEGGRLSLPYINVLRLNLALDAIDNSK